MSYELDIWKRSTTAKDTNPAEIYKSIVRDRSHPALERFDASAFERTPLRLFAADLEDGELPFEYSNGDFTGEAANWFLMHLSGGKVEHAEFVVRAAIEHGLVVYDPQFNCVYGNDAQPKK